MTMKVQVTSRRSGKVLKTETLPREAVEKAMVDRFQGATEAIVMRGCILSGNSYQFQYGQNYFTVEPRFGEFVGGPKHVAG